MLLNTKRDNKRKKLPNATISLHIIILVLQCFVKTFVIDDDFKFLINVLPSKCYTLILPNEFDAKLTQRYFILMVHLKLIPFFVISLIEIILQIYQKSIMNELK